MRKRLVQALSSLIGASVAVSMNGTTAAADKLSRFKAWSPRQLGAVVNKRAEAHDWSGFYAGLHAGYGWSHTEAEAYWGSMVGDREPFSYGSRGALGGIHLGYNVLIDNIVFGLETDMEASGLHGSGTGGCAYHQTDIDWSTSLRLRVGLQASDRSLVYVTGGVTYANVSVAQHTFTGIAPYTTHNAWQVGWNLGGGVEHAITPKITARLEYRYLDLGKISYTDELLAMKTTHAVTNHSVRAGFSVRF